MMRIAIVIALLAAAPAVPAASVQTGKLHYAVCAGCHGFKAEGNRAIAAPKLTGLDADYLERQLRYFDEGIRGADANDLHGQRMAPFALALPDDRAIEDVIAYIQSLPHRRPEPALDGDLERGRASYATCAACHGQDGEGVAALSAPALTGLEDWYIVSQLELYRSGARGTAGADTFGRPMRPIVMTLGDDGVFEDIAAYISSLATGEDE